MENDKQLMTITSDTPAVTIANGEAAAKVLQGVIDRKPSPVIINNERYLEYEDWQTLGRFYGLSVSTGEAQLVEIGGVRGFKAAARVLTKDGVVVGGAEAYCMRDEEQWQNKPWFQLASMAQTRAGSKALSNVLRWVAVLAGYKGTPAEEMTNDSGKGKYWCARHETFWFKKGNMKRYAHPIEGTKPVQWCAMPEENETIETPSVQDDSSPQAVSATPTKDEWNSLMTKASAKGISSAQIAASLKKYYKLTPAVKQDGSYDFVAVPPDMTLDQFIDLRDRIERYGA